MKSKGFTLIELLVVISIIGVLSSIVLVFFSGSRDKARLADVFAGLIRAYYNDIDNEKARGLYKLASKKITTQLVSGQMIR